MEHLTGRIQGRRASESPAKNASAAYLIYHSDAKEECQGKKPLGRLRRAPARESLGNTLLDIYLKVFTIKVDPVALLHLLSGWRNGEACEKIESSASAAASGGKGKSDSA